MRYGGFVYIMTNRPNGTLYVGVRDLRLLPPGASKVCLGDIRTGRLLAPGGGCERQHPGYAEQREVAGKVSSPHSSSSCERA